VLIWPRYRRYRPRLGTPTMLTEHLVAVNLQIAWLSPLVALSAYFLKGVVPEWNLKDIYRGMVQSMSVQLFFGLLLIIIFPQFALWLPGYLYPNP